MGHMMAASAHGAKEQVGIIFIKRIDIIWKIRKRDVLARNNRRKLQQLIGLGDINQFVLLEFY